MKRILRICNIKITYLYFDSPATLSSFHRRGDVVFFDVNIAVLSAHFVLCNNFDISYMRELQMFQKVEYGGGLIFKVVSGC